MSTALAIIHLGYTESHFNMRHRQRQYAGVELGVYVWGKMWRALGLARNLSLQKLRIEKAITVCSVTDLKYSSDI